MKNGMGALGTSPGNVGMFDDLAASIWQSYVDGKVPSPIPPEPPQDLEPSRRPVTQEFMVQALVAERNGEGCNHPAKEYFKAALYESIHRMVGMLASKYSITCIDQENDLAQECWIRIWDKLDNFDASRGKFTTWAWGVCRSVLNRQYRRSQKLKDHISHQPDENIERNSSKDVHYDSMLELDYAEAVRALGKKYPKWKSFIYALLGNPDTGFVPGTVCVTHAARDVGVGRGGAMKFYHQKVQPFMQERFGR